MYHHYRIIARFRNETCEFLIKKPTYLKVIDTDICDIICKKYQTTIPSAEISYTKEAITAIDYSLSDLEKHELDIPVEMP
jgi:hypothetical protein